MTANPSPLGEQIAGLRIAASTDSKSAWLPEVLHTLIMACLVRFFTRLEQIFQLWQAGQLPTPHPRTSPHPAAPHPPCAQPASETRAPRTPASRHTRAHHPTPPVRPTKHHRTRRGPIPTGPPIPESVARNAAPPATARAPPLKNPRRQPQLRTPI